MELFDLNNHQDKIHQKTKDALLHSDLQIIRIVTPEPESCRESFIQQFPFIQAAGGIVRNDTDQLLVIFRRGFWDLPKGKLDPFESLEECATREVFEETGIKADITNSTPFTTYHLYFQDDIMVVKNTHWYSMRYTFGEPIPQEEEQIQSVQWADQTFLRTSVYSNTYPLIRDLLQLKHH